MKEKIEADAARLEARVGPMEDLVKALRSEKHRAAKLEEQLHVTQRDLWNAMIAMENTTKEEDDAAALSAALEAARGAQRQAETKLVSLENDARVALDDLRKSMQADIAKEKILSSSLRIDLEETKEANTRISLELARVRRLLALKEDEISEIITQRQTVMSNADVTMDVLISRSLYDWASLFSPTTRGEIKSASSSSVRGALPCALGSVLQGYGEKAISIPMKIASASMFIVKQVFFTAFFLPIGR